MGRITVVTMTAMTIVAGSGCGREASGQGPAVAHWQRALQDPDVRVRRQAADALSQLGGQAAAALKDRDRTVREQAAYTLAEIGPPAAAAIPALREALKERDGSVRAAANQALKKIQGAG